MRYLARFAALAAYRLTRRLRRQPRVSLAGISGRPGVSNDARGGHRVSALEALIDARQERGEPLQAVPERERLIDALFEQHDHEALRSCLAELERAVRGALSGGEVLVVEFRAQARSQVKKLNPVHGGERHPGGAEQDSW